MPGLPSDRVLVPASSAATAEVVRAPGLAPLSIWTGLLFDLAPRQADADRDGRVTMGEALRWSTYFAQKMTKVQQPYGRQTPEVHGDPVLGWTLDAPPA